MRILPGTYAVFWSRPGWGQQFQADVVATCARQAAATFRSLFPGDLIRSVRGRDGRFASF